MLLSVEFRSHSAIALYIKPNYNYQVINVPLPFAFCQAPYKEKLAEVLKAVVDETGDEEVFSYPANNKLVIVDESVFSKLRATLGLSTIYINDTFSEVLSLPEVARFLPFKIDLMELSNLRANQNLLGNFFPTTAPELAIQAAICKAIIRQLGFYTHELPPETLLSGPVFNQVPSPRAATEIFLDGVDGSGMTYLYHDRVGLSAAIAAASLLLVKNDFAKLGSMVIWPGPTTFELWFGGRDTPLKMSLKNNEVSRLDVQADQTVKLKARGPHGDLDATLPGGEMGVILDTRERPLTAGLKYESLNPA